METSARNKKPKSPEINKYKLEKKTPKSPKLNEYFNNELEKNLITRVFISRMNGVHMWRINFDGFMTPKIRPPKKLPPCTSPWWGRTVK